MARRITVTGATRRRIETDRRTARKVDEAVVATAFGERVSARASVGPGIDLWTVKRALRNMLTSTGGRPGFAASVPMKIPCLEGDWSRLEAIASASKDLPFKPSPTQVAAAVLHLALENFSDDQITRSLRRL